MFYLLTGDYKSSLSQVAHDRPENSQQRLLQLMLDVVLCINGLVVPNHDLRCVRVCGLGSLQIRGQAILGTHKGR